MPFTAAEIKDYNDVRKWLYFNVHPKAAISRIEISVEHTWIVDDYLKKLTWFTLPAKEFYGVPIRWLSEETRIVEKNVFELLAAQGWHEGTHK